MARVNIFSPEGKQERELLAHNTLGRHPENTIQLLDRIVSKEHCHIDKVEGGFMLRDLGSLNGTFVNGERVTERVLADGDEISLGATRIIYTADPVGAPAGAPVPTTGGGMSRVTIAPGMVESHIRTKLQPLLDQNFLPERLVQSVDVLRQDYEKLRVSYEVIRAIGVELDVDKLLTKIIDCAFQLLQADRGVILLYDENKELKPRCVRTKKVVVEGEDVVL